TLGPTHARWRSRSAIESSSRSARIDGGRSLVGSGVSAGRPETHAVRQPTAAAPATSDAQSSPTWRIAEVDGSPRAERADAKLAGCGLITPTRWLITTARRQGRQPRASP